jgi:branched-chain amino acid transport system substrate-binding protein
MASSSTSNAAASGSPIKIGVICDCSGALASAGTDAPDIYQAWADTVNAAGGINGHHVQVILDNDGSNPGTALTDVENLIQSDHVIALVDISNLDETFASFVKSHDVPVIGINTSETPMFSNSAFYPQAQTEDALFASVIDSAKSAGATNLGLLYCAEAVQCQEAIAPLKAATKALNLPLGYSGEISATAPSYTAQCVAAQQAHITALFVADIAVVAAKVAQDCSQQGYHPVYVLDGEDLTGSFATTAGLKDNLVGPSPNVPFYASTPAVTAMNAALDKYYPGLRENTAVYNEFSMGSWVAGLLFQAAAKAGGVGANGTTPTAAQVIKGLTSLKGETLDGMAPPLTFVPGQAHPVDCWFTYALKNGKFSLPNGTSTTCENS